MNNDNNTEPVLYAVGARGYSAYEVAVQNGFVGTEQEWLDSLVGPEGQLGPEGKSAYAIAVENGYEGTEQDWVNDFLTPDGYYNKTEINNLINGQLKKSDVIDNVISDTTDKPLSANQGYILNTKIEDLEDDVQDNTTNLGIEISSRIENENLLKQQINGLANGAPLAATSTADMTDTTKIYVNTTDGDWYYYDGNDWVSGGVYQAVALSDDTVSYKNQNLLLRSKDFRQINADEIFFRKGYTCNSGKLVSNWNTVASQLVLVAKGTVITFSSNIQAKVTEYNLDKTYKRDSGGHAVMTSWTVTDDCYVRITMMTNTADPISRDDGNSTNIQIVGLVPITRGTSIVEGLNFHSYTSAYYISDRLYVNAGTVIKMIDDGTKDTNGDDAGATMSFAVREAGVLKDPGTAGNYGHTDYVVQNNGFIEIMVNFSATIENYHLSRIKNMLSIDLKEFQSYKSTLNAYITDNKGLDIREVSGGKVVFKLNSDLEIYNQNKRNTITWSSIKTTLSANVIEIDGEEYIEIPVLSTVNYNLHSQTVYLSAYNTGSKALSDDDIVLLANANSNITGGCLLDIYNKNQSIKGDPERLTKQLFNSAPFIKDFNWLGEVKRYSSKLNGMSKNIEGFIFFTDPHLLAPGNSFNETRLQNYFGTLQKIYNSAPFSFIACGGDWLTDGDVQDYACFKLGYLTGFMNSMFKNYYPIKGNHDTNYQGKLDEDSENFTGILPEDTVTNLLFPTYKKNYYSFKGNNSTNYILDSHLDYNWGQAMNAYKWEQIDWLANSLKDDDSAHSTVMIHIIWLDNTHTATPFAENITQLIDAYNNHTSITLNSVTYNFAGCTGKVEYVLTGHLHHDYDAVINNVLCVGTTTFALGQSTPTFDMIINDYDNDKVYMLRVGAGSDREFTI